MVALAASNVLLLPAPLYVWMGCAQLLFYGMVLLGGLWRIRPSILRLPYYFCMINAAAFVGMYYALRGSRQMAWKRR